VESRSAAWHRWRAREAQQRREWFAAAWHLDRLVEQAGAASLEADVFVRRARALGELGDWRRAESDYSRAIELGEEGADILTARGRTRVQLGEWSQACDDLARAVEQGKDEWTFSQAWEAQAALVAARAELGQWSAAASELAECFALASDQLQTQLAEQEAQTHESAGNWSAALMFLNFLANHSWPLIDRADCQARAANACVRLGRWDEARRLCDLAIDQGADQWWVWRTRGMARMGQGQWQAAAGDLSAALDRKPDEALSLACRAAVRAVLEDWEGAMADADAAIKLGADPGDVWRNTSKVLSAAIRRDPANPRLWSARARASEQLGDRDEAAADHARAAELSRKGD
jgi:tetratricopeptide (TPR) repeat protein